MKTLPISEGHPRTICRSAIYTDVIHIYREEDIIFEFPLCIEFLGEIAFDCGGVTREMFSAFWDKCYANLFDGSTLLVPMLNPQTDISILPIIGRIISHGYLSCGFLPIRIALPCLVGILCGSSTVIPQTLLQDAFLDYISNIEKSLFKEALNCVVFTPEVQEKLLTTLSRFGCRQLPTPSNLLKCLQQIAFYEFCTKPAAAIALIHSGVPSSHLTFWRDKSVDGICSLYKSLAVSAHKVIDILKVAHISNAAEERIYGYLVEMIGNMPEEQLQAFLRFVKGSSVLITNQLQIKFNRLSGFARRPIAHTCDFMLELPVAYENYHDFYSEWLAVLMDPDIYV